MNSEIQIRRSPNLPVGNIEFFDKIVPPLMAGDYSVTLLQNLVYGGEKQTLQRMQNFSVQAPRFSLASGDVQSVFPADGCTGKFDNCLPQIVLNKRALPWEHWLEQGDTSGAPWMALLVLDGSEISVPQNGVAAPSLTLSAAFQLGDVRNLNAGAILGPSIAHLDYGQSDGDIVRTIDLSTSIFLALVPHLDNAAPATSELCSLAHVRQVNMEHKEILNMTHSGWFSLIVANRFPINPDRPTRQFVHLVSLEGFKPYLADGATFAPGVSTVRLISLYSWSFTCLPDHGESFSSFMLNLMSDASEQNTGLTLRMPVAPDVMTNDASPNKIVSKALQNGYVPLAYNSLYGDKTLSWYRSPLSPLKPDNFTRGSALPQFNAASDAVIFDPQTGLFNLSYSVAWQTGRLMALGNRAFATSLMDWRRKLNRIIDLLANLAQEDQLQNFLDTYDGDINQFFHDQLITESFLNFMLNDFSKLIAPNVNANAVSFSSAADAAATDAELPPQLVEELQKLLQNDQVAALLNDVEGQELQTIVEWLAHTSLLYDVPFDHLVADTRLLPIESIRFFYLDRNWTDSLIDGAMSIGVQSSKDSHYYKITKNLIRDALDKLILDIREKLLGLPTTDKDPTDGVIAGFLLRSAVLTQYPGIEIKGYRSVGKNDDGAPQGVDRMQLLRLDRLSSNVLICLFPDAPAWIEFDEPSEGLCFGVEPSQQALEIAIRDLGNGEVLPDAIYTLDTVADFRGAQSNRVLNVKHLNAALAAKLGKASLNAAEFALQLVKVPEQLVFTNQAQTSK
ncbi:MULTISPECIES: hypothetical protein [Burkholderiaceae]|uniref:hypothetical protein n=1 Tax=Burkholderiaceae TaxID=119060 RepID=UPI0009604A17|nr:MULTISPECIES: hypothetical protein [Burkholderiaceae]MCG1038840.1 hypothetical protein [Mycetohabitans sp. B7]SIT68564.1 hypothetical protein SAMN04487769_1345 [Burkholderia sp. b14]